MTIRLKLIPFSFLCACLLSAPALADVVPTMILDAGGGNIATITDPLHTGVLQFSGALGNFSVNVTTGLTQPTLPNARLDLSSVNVSYFGQGPGTLGITFGATGFTGPSYLAGGTLNASGTIGGFGSPASILISGYEDNGNGLFATTNSVGTAGATTDALGKVAVFSSSPTASFGVTQPFSLTESAVIKFGAAGGFVGFDAAIAPIPEPASIVLFSLVVLGFCGMLHRNRKTGPTP
jgi:hypothetical protein